ncbi:MAG: BrnT family toxin [Planctomycetota bacterium]
MGYSKAIWDLDDDPAGNVLHIAEHGVTKEEVEEVLENPDGIETSRSSGRPIAFGETSTGRLIAVIYEEIDEDTVYPVTAYEVET